MKKSLFFLLLILLFSAFFFFKHQQQNKYAEALKLYHQGMTSEDTIVKNQRFNEALEELLSLEEESSSKNALIGELLAKLGQYPLALYFYLQAFELEPENKEIQRAIEMVIQEGQLPTALPPFSRLKKGKLWFSGLFIAWIALLSWALLKNQKKLQKLAFYLAAPLSLFGVYLAGRIFFAPLYGVMIHSQELYQEAGKQKAILSPIPLPPGIIITVLGEEQKGEWLKIKTSDGVMGFVPEDAIRVLF